LKWPIVRLIFARELRDQLRDRRTLFMIAVLPLLLYPILGFAVLQFALGFAERKSVVGIAVGSRGSRDFPERSPSGLSPIPVASWFALAGGSGGMGLDLWPGAVSLSRASHSVFDYPLFISDGEFTARGDSPVEALLLDLNRARLQLVFLIDADRRPLDERKVDVILSAPQDFFARVAEADTADGPLPPGLKLQWRKDDDNARQAYTRLLPFVQRWKADMKKTRLARHGLPGKFDETFVLDTPLSGKLGVTESLFDLLVRIFPFMLVMWSLAGALYPAVDLCAGEKERGTMETLLISPAGREEIVLGKFLTIWVFSAATAILNLASMGITTWQFSTQIPHGGLTIGALLWCVVLVLPLSAFFSALCLAIGAYARSSKEGQYYLMPLFLVTMPLIFLTLAPGVHLNPFYSLVPVTGVALLMQKLMTAPTLDQVPWLFFVPVLAPVALYSWVALRWAIEQFKREEVLFREAERLDVRLWLRRLFREKEALPTMGQALFCFGLIMALRWLSMRFGLSLPVLVFTGISVLAFVAAPASLMTLLLNTRPREALVLRWPTWRDVGVAAALALLLLPPLTGLAQLIFTTFPDLADYLQDRQPFMSEVRSIAGGGIESPPLAGYLLIFGLLAPVCEELAFRGFILTGLLQWTRPRNAVLLSSFLFALFHMNVFQFLPAFLLGVVFGLLRVRSHSLVPPIIFHVLHNSILMTGMFVLAGHKPQTVANLWPMIIVVCLILGVSLLWWLYRVPYWKMAAEAQASRK
jgi:sodium transport system permease protein